ncbi:hypothetical protein [Oleiharenicola lentus]|uniref:hypothetical protein n=1 Tax=Oleiharenicola lentus TaxID=2508720 RepID=UPI003F671FF8
MSAPDDEPEAIVLPFIKRGDIAHYRHLARTADETLLRELVLVMAEDIAYLVHGVVEPESV